MKIISKVSFLIIVGLLTFSGCTNFIITKDNIKILKTEKHPFLVDHKKIIIVEFDKDRIDKVNGYSDSGRGCNSHLFEENDKFVLIDCNGTIFSIRKKGGKIKNEGWSWMYELPEKYVGTFENQEENDEYSLVYKTPPTLEEVYKIKDPND